LTFSHKDNPSALSGIITRQKFQNGNSRGFLPNAAGIQANLRKLYLFFIIHKLSTPKLFLKGGLTLAD
jgi:hypothetical protein